MPYISLQGFNSRRVFSIAIILISAGLIFATLQDSRDTILVSRMSHSNDELYAVDFEVFGRVQGLI